MGVERLQVAIDLEKEEQAGRRLGLIHVEPEASRLAAAHFGVSPRAFAKRFDVVELDGQMRGVDAVANTRKLAVSHFATSVVSVELVRMPSSTS